MSVQDLSPKSHVVVVSDVELKVFHTTAENLTFLLKMLCTFCGMGENRTVGGHRLGSMS